jgi:hypothetical protein
MKAKKTAKGFDCLAFKDRVQAEIYAETKGMTFAQLRQYFRERVESGPFADLWKRIPSRSERSARHSSRRAS